MNGRQIEQASDWDLLSRYADRNDADAFGIVVRRHIGFVYSSARRQTRDAHLADDVTQAVFIVLARKAGSLRARGLLTSWLFTVTRHAAQNAMKMQIRRQLHEARALLPEPAGEPTDALESTELRGVLDDAIARLPRLERDGVLLHYFQGKTHEQVGISLGLSAEAARKRISRAVDRMRLFLQSRGVGATGASIAGAMTGGASLAASPALIESTIHLATLANAVHAGASVATIAQGVTRMFTLAKLKAAAVVTVATTLVGGAVAVPIAAIAGADRDAVAPLASPVQQLMVTSSTALVTAPEAPKFVTEIDENTKIEFLGVSRFPAQDGAWWSIAGEPIDDPALPEQKGRFMAQPPPEYQVVVLVHKPHDTLVRVKMNDAGMVAVDQNNNSDGQNDQLFLTTAFSLQGGGTTTGLRIGLATEAWKTVGEHASPADEAAVDAGDFGQFRFSPAVAGERSATSVEVVHEESEQPLRVVAIDEAGKEHDCTHINVNTDGQNTMTTYGFDIAPDAVKKFAVQARPFAKFVDVENISLSPDQKTEPKITVTDRK